MASRFMGNKKMMPGPGIMSMLPESRPIRPPREFISPLGPADKPMRLPPAPSMQGLAGLQERLGSLESRERFDPTGIQEQIAELQGRQMFDPTGLQEQITALQEARPNVPPSLMGITMDPAPDPITGDRYPVISIEEEPAVDFKKDPVPAMSMVEQLQQMIADMQAQQQTQAAQQQEQAAARAAQEAEMSKQYLIPAGPQGYNPYLSGQYQGDPYGAQGVPSMGGITTIPVPEDYLGV